MKPQLHFTFRNIAAAPARALSAKQILVMTTALVAALVVYDLAFYLAHLAGGSKLSVVYKVYGFSPGLLPGVPNLSAKIIFGVGILISVFVVMLGMLGVAAITIEHIRGNRFFSAGEAFRFALSRAKTLFLCEAAILLFVTFIVAVFMGVGLIGRIPFAGEWLYSFFLIFPLYFIALFTVLIVLIAQVSVILTPAIAATDRKGETFGLIVETFSTITRQPLRWVGYTAYAIVAGKLASFIYAYFAVRSVQGIVWATGLTDGGRMQKLVQTALSHLPVRSDIVSESLNVFPGINWGVSLIPFVQSGDSVVSHVMAFMLFVIFLSVIAYFLCVITSTQVYGYVLIRYFKDGYRLDEESAMGEADTSNTPDASMQKPSTSDNSTPDPA